MVAYATFGILPEAVRSLKASRVMSSGTRIFPWSVKLLPSGSTSMLNTVNTSADMPAITISTLNT